MTRLHMTEAEVARDLHGVLTKVQQGADVVVEQPSPVAVINSAQPKGRLISECIAVAESRGSIGLCILRDAQSRGLPVEGR